MNLDSVQDKYLGQIEQLTKELLLILTKKAKLNDEPICRELELLAKEASEERILRFDAADKQYKGF